METIRINVSLPTKLLADLTREVGPRQRSRFIGEAVERLIRERRDQRLAAEYQEAATEIRRINSEMEGAVGDGLD
ncbi:MAG: hypothetical protein ABIL58_26655 [Pseudomonadota bacterium]